LTLAVADGWGTGRLRRVRIVGARSSGGLPVAFDTARGKLLSDLIQLASLTWLDDKVTTHSALACRSASALRIALVRVASIARGGSTFGAKRSARVETGAIL